jgi:thiamine kinase-like enzyme
VSFSHAPRFLGIDAEGREILTYVHGQVPADLGWFSDSQVRAAARIIRRFHDCTAGTDLSANQQVVCHGDLSPCNFVFQSGTPSCLIDFDAAYPGPRRIDIGYAVWLWLDIGNPELDPYDTGRRIAAFLAEYGPDSLSDPTQAIVDSQDWLFDRNVNAGCPRAEEIARWTRCCRQWVEDHRVLLEAGLRTHAA